MIYVQTLKMFFVCVIIDIYALHLCHISNEQITPTLSNNNKKKQLAIGNYHSILETRFFVCLSWFLKQCSVEWRVLVELCIPFCPTYFMSMFRDFLAIFLPKVFKRKIVTAQKNPLLECLPKSLAPLGLLIR